MGQAAAAYDEPRTPNPPVTKEESSPPFGAETKQAPVIDVANIEVAALNKSSNQLEWIPWAFTKWAKDQTLALDAGCTSSISTLETKIQKRAKSNQKAVLEATK